MVKAISLYVVAGGIIETFWMKSLNKNIFKSHLLILSWYSREKGKHCHFRLQWASLPTRDVLEYTDGSVRICMEDLRPFIGASLNHLGPRSLSQ